jgi:hypothetical protein
MENQKSICDAMQGSPGQAATPPPTSVMNSRRLTRCPSSTGSYTTMLRAALCITANSDCQCPLWVKSRHQGLSARCPLYPQKQTLELSREVAALCEKRTSPYLFKHLVGAGEGYPPTPSLVRAAFSDPKTLSFCGRARNDSRRPLERTSDSLGHSHT